MPIAWASRGATEVILEPGIKKKVAEMLKILNPSGRRFLQKKESDRILTAVANNKDRTHKLR